MDSTLTHLDSAGNAHLVNIAAKDETRRLAAAKGRIRMKPETLSAICEGSVPKGDVLAAARIAGIMAAKKTWALIPLCHPLGLERCTLDFRVLAETNELEVQCTAGCSGKTGVEMEALTAVSISLLTVYDMCKAIDRDMEIHSIALWEKSGGKSGGYVRDRSLREDD